MLSVTTRIRPEFYDLDPMGVVWHGNYPRFLEIGRCALMERIGYSYPEMTESGFLWPVVHLQLKYVRPAKLHQALEVVATLTEYHTRLKVDYEIRDAASGEVITKGYTVQVAVSAATGETQLECPEALLAKLETVA